MCYLLEGNNNHVQPLQHRQLQLLLKHDIMMKKYQHTRTSNEDFMLITLERACYLLGVHLACFAKKRSIIYDYKSAIIIYPFDLYIFNYIIKIEQKTTINKGHVKRYLHGHSIEESKKISRSSSTREGHMENIRKISRI